ncbi:MAG TPA: nitrilase-related carbon-nitrogen hydrolase [Clostridia bacterium]|nr:nitrilase-related carbon-nitrogen hydrolase [Clostridia bacterium]
MNEMANPNATSPKAPTLAIADAGFEKAGVFSQERIRTNPVLLQVTTVLGWGTVAALSLHGAYALPYASMLVLVYLFALLQMAQVPSRRLAFYGGLAVGLLAAAGQLGFFWRIFGVGAIALWLVYASWVAFFVVFARMCLTARDTASAGGEIAPLGLRPTWKWLLIPFAWCGFEYFRSELYYLRFSWVSPGFAFGTMPNLAPLGLLGTYGVGFVLIAIACVAAIAWSQSKVRSAAVLISGTMLVWLMGHIFSQMPQPEPARSVRIAGVQMEFPTEKEVLVRLNELVRKHPEAELLVLSEYTFNDPLPETIKEWCRRQQRYLIVGAKDPLPDGNFYNTAFVISPAGEIVFRQAKSVPIQFFKDGLPAREQKAWHSPWGKIGICICYDLSYSRVTDRLVRAGAEAMIVPTMDVTDWGLRQHQLHGRVAPVRAAEYGMPVFRLASSGISQVVDRAGHVSATAPCPGDGAVLYGTLEFRGPGHLPLDRWLGPISTGITVAALAGFCAAFPGRKRQIRTKPGSATL